MRRPCRTTVSLPVRRGAAPGPIALFVTLFALVAAPLSGQTTIETSRENQGYANPYNDGTGQTFTAPTVDRYLTSVRFGYFDNPDFGLSILSLSIYAWSGTGVLGSALFTSGLYSRYAADFVYEGEFGYVPSYYEWAVGGLELVAGQQYAALVDVVNNGGSYMRIQNGWEYLGGQFVQYPESEGQPERSGDAVLDEAHDADFRAEFAATPTVVPEPTTWFLLATGLLSLSVAVRRRRCDGEDEGTA